MVAAHRHCTGGWGGREISARTACRSIDLVFSSTTFSGMRSAATGALRGRTLSHGPAGPPSSSQPQAPDPPTDHLPLTLVLDEAVSCQELQ